MTCKDVLDLRKCVFVKFNLSNQRIPPRWWQSSVYTHVRNAKSSPKWVKFQNHMALIAPIQNQTLRDFCWSWWILIALKWTSFSFLSLGIEQMTLKDTFAHCSLVRSLSASNRFLRGLLETTSKLPGDELRCLLNLFYRSQILLIRNNFERMICRLFA